jgi:purine nucleoside permease
MSYVRSFWLLAWQVAYEFKRNELTMCQFE